MIGREPEQLRSCFFEKNENLLFDCGNRIRYIFIDCSLKKRRQGMCQAFEGERAYMIVHERRVALDGFRLAFRKDPQSSNPYNPKWEKDDFDAWNHGWSCFQGRLFPFGLEVAYRDYYADRLKKDWYKYGLPRFRTMEKAFKKTGKIPRALKKLIGA